MSYISMLSGPPSTSISKLFSFAKEKIMRLWNLVFFNKASFFLQMAMTKGGLTSKEAWYLRSLSASIAHGYLLEVGSFRGKSAVALFFGTRARGSSVSPKIFCIEPHRDFVGVYGGQFGPTDRAAFYRTMLRTGAFRDVALINLRSCEAARCWDRPLGMVFIDGDHTYEGVSSDVANWEKHLVPGGLLVFDDATDPSIGPHRVVNELMGSGRYEQTGAVGKVIALQKHCHHKSATNSDESKCKRILILTTALYMSGGMLRFERVGRVLQDQGHRVAFCAVRSVDRPKNWTGQLPLIGLDEAWSKQWDVTMLPGRAAIDEEKLFDWLKIFTDTRFGLRIQHILNDRTYEAAFLELNRVFLPHVVVFNNEEWPVGSFTEFAGNEFHVLQGGVDWQRFSSCARESSHTEIVIGGQARKNPWPLIRCLEALPSQYKLNLFGPASEELRLACQNYLDEGRVRLSGELCEEQLPDFYCKVDVVVATEENAGWSNLTAEAMAAGVPVICTPAGTGAVAENYETALLIERPDPDLIVAALKELFDDLTVRERIVERARTHIQQYGWDIYARELLAIMSCGQNPHYYFAPAIGMFGKWAPEERLEGLDAVLSQIGGKRVLDVGSAEGMLSRACLDAGAALVHGIDVDQSRVEKARILCGPSASFFVFNLNDPIDLLSSLPLLSTYDVILYLGVHHHLKPEAREGVVRQLAKQCSGTFVLRTSEAVYQQSAFHRILREERFRRVEKVTKCGASTLGTLWTYTR